MYYCETEEGFAQVNVTTKLVLSSEGHGCKPTQEPFMMPDTGETFNNENISVEVNGTDYGTYTPLVVPSYQQAISITMYSIVIVLAVGGNTTVCYIVFSARRMRTVMNFFIVSLALSDILMAVICIPFTFIANLVINSWPFGYALCPIVTFLQVVTVFMSSFTLVAISIDRYSAIVHPLRPKMTKRQALIVISCIWILSALIPLPTAIKSRVHQYVNDSNAPWFCEEMWENVTAHSVYNAILLLSQYFIPLVILVFTYGRIILVLWIKKTPGEAVGSRDLRMSRSKKKIIKMMIVVVVIYSICWHKWHFSGGPMVFIHSVLIIKMMIVVVVIYSICWLPLHVITIAGDINMTFYNLPGMNILWTFSHWLAMSNCMYNPFIYCWMNDKFRKGFLKVLKCFTCGMLKTGDDFELQRIHNTYNTASAYNHRLSAKTANGESEYTVLEVKLYGGNDLTEASSSQS